MLSPIRCALVKTKQCHLFWEERMSESISFPWHGYALSKYRSTSLAAGTAQSRGYELIALIRIKINLHCPQKHLHKWEWKWNSDIYIRQN